MKIIIQGRLPEDRIFRSTCTHCRTVYEYNRMEANFVSNARNEDYLVTNCPLCDNKVYQQV